MGLLLEDEADCLNHQHKRRRHWPPIRRQRRAAAPYRASGLVLSDCYARQVNPSGCRMLNGERTVAGWVPAAAYGRLRQFSELSPEGALESSSAVFLQAGSMRTSGHFQPFTLPQGDSS
ncbi:hypothetical protein OKW30_006814 [Paraburkholderia sp. Clong3]